MVQGSAKERAFPTEEMAKARTSDENGKEVIMAELYEQEEKKQYKT